MVTVLIWLFLCVSNGIVSTTDKPVLGSYVYDKKTAHLYRLVYEAKPWLVARQHCLDESAKLAVPTNIAEFKFIQSIVRKMEFPLVQEGDDKTMAWIGIYFDVGQKHWKTIDGDDVKNHFHQWAGENGHAQNYVTNSTHQVEPLCVGVDAINPGLRDSWCNLKMPFMCQTH